AASAGMAGGHEAGSDADSDALVLADRAMFVESTTSAGSAPASVIAGTAARQCSRPPPPPLLAGLLHDTESELRALERRALERTRLLERIEELDTARCRQQSELATAEHALIEWTRQWHALAEALGLAPATAPAE